MAIRWQAWFGHSPIREAIKKQSESALGWRLATQLDPAAEPLAEFGNSLVVESDLVTD